MSDFKRPDRADVPLHMVIGCAGHLCYLFENQLLEEHGITAKQAKILFFLIENEEAEINQRTLEKEFRLTAATITSALSNLEKAGFIRRTVGAGDARNKILAATERGRELRTVIRLCENRVREVAFSDITEEERTVLRGICDRVIQNVHRELEETKHEKMG